jgi:hypothetical protein
MTTDLLFYEAPLSTGEFYSAHRGGVELLQSGERPAAALRAAQLELA